MKDSLHLILALLLFPAIATAGERASDTRASTSKSITGPATPATVVGHARDFIITPDLAKAPPDGEKRVWRHEIEIADASFIKMHFVNLNLNGADELILRKPNGRIIERYRGRGPKDRGTFWALSVPGDQASLELRFARPYTGTPFTIDKVIAGDSTKTDFAARAGRSVCGAPDFEDSICYQDDADKWSNAQASVGVMLVGGDASTSLYCSGSLVSPRNYVLTNNHCISSQGQCDNAEFVFNYHRSACNIAAPANTDWVSYRCDELHESQPLESCEAVPGELDFSLVSVLGEPAATFGYVQPDATPISNGEALYILQHPDGRPQEITHGTDVEVDGSVLRYWNTLDTETGSSGSGIFRDADDALVGLHHCGGCAAPDQRNRGMLMTDLMPLIESYLCTETLSLTAATPGPLLEVAGNNNGVIEAGEQWSFLPRVLNSSCGDTINNASAVIGIAAESEADISLVETSADFGSIAPGQVADAAGPVHFDVAGGAGCGDSIIIDMGPLTGDAGQFSGANQVMATVGVENFETVLFEDFANGIPADWTVANFGTGSGPAQTWTSDNPGNRLPGLVAPFVIVDSDQNEGFMDEELITPVVDVSAYPTVRLRFSHDFNWYEVGGDEQADVEVRSSATFGAWLTIENFSGDDSSGTVELDITEWAADDLQLRFRYYNAFFDWWWAVDDVAILGSLGFACLTPGDTDGDSVSDELDNCTLAANPQQTDSDQDGIGNACDADINPQNDCLVNFADLSVLTSAFFSVPTAEQWNPDADFNGDNIVNFSDLSVLSEQFFLSPGPSSLPNNCQRAGH